MRALCVVAGLCVLCCGGWFATGCGKGDSREVTAESRALTLHTRDGVQLGAVLYPAVSETPPGLILVHRYGARAESWRAFALAARGEGYHCVAFDVRGHGASARRGEIPLDYRAFSHEQWLAAAADARATKEALLEAGADPDNIVVLGEGLGAALALRYMRMDSDIQAAVLVSPSLDEKGFDSAADLRALWDRPVLIVAAENDSAAATAATALKQTAAGFCELRLYPGAAHGTDLLAASEAARLQVLGWLQTVLGGLAAPGAASGS
ncbi:MAG TPA: alpha/beta fold hydrolase [Candidatus Hydrogenedentes bacterium]|nr:alpha/beta fold hydrolase [Candidatus Hydrogenedentota bacterium]